MIVFKLAYCLALSLGAATDNAKSPLIADMDRDITAFYKRYRESDSDRDKMNAVVDLCQLHNQVWSDPRYAMIEKLRGMRNKLVFQLKAAEKDIRKSLPEGMGDSRGAARHKSFAGRSDFASPGDDPSRSADGLRREMINALLLGLQYTPGPDQIAVHAGSFAGDDYGPELVALIEATIHPEHWDTNGGPGHIQYYRPVMVIVARAGSVTHDDTTDVLQRLRDSGQ